MPKDIEHAVIERAGDNICVTLHGTEMQAENYAVKLAMENKTGTDDEIRKHLRQRGSHAEGDYEVILADAVHQG